MAASFYDIPLDVAEFTLLRDEYLALIGSLGIVEAERRIGEPIGGVDFVANLCRVEVVGRDPPELRLVPTDKFDCVLRALWRN